MKRIIMFHCLLGSLMFFGSVFAKEPDVLCYHRVFERKECDKETWDKLWIITQILCILDKNGFETSKESPVDSARKTAGLVTDLLQLEMSDKKDWPEISWSFTCEDKSTSKIDDQDWQKLIEVGQKIREAGQAEAPITTEKLTKEFEYILLLLEDKRNGLQGK